jgi:hypothetical protein
MEELTLKLKQKDEELDQQVDEIVEASFDEIDQKIQLISNLPLCITSYHYYQVLISSFTKYNSVNEYNLP